MTYTEALKLAKSGKRINRVGREAYLAWNRVAECLYLFGPAKIPQLGPHPVTGQGIASIDQPAMPLPCPWVATQEDLEATDWVLFGGDVAGEISERRMSARCSHINVGHRTEDFPYQGDDVSRGPDVPPLRAGQILTRQWWECRDCRLKFQPMGIATGSGESVALLPAEHSKRYIMVVDRRSVDAQALFHADMTGAIECCVMVLPPPGATVQDCIAVAETQAVENARSDEREACAGIVDHAFDHLSPLAIYESYRGGDRPVTRLNAEASGSAIAAKIRSRR